MKLQLEGIYRNFKDKKVLENITLTMENVVYGLLGPNGARSRSEFFMGHEENAQGNSFTDCLKS